MQIELYVAALFKAFKDDTFMSLEKKRLMKIQNAIGSLQPQGRLIRPAMRSMGMMVRITEAFADDEDVKNASYHDEVEVALSNADDIEVAQKRITKILNQLMEMMKSPLAYTVLPTLASLTESLTQHADDLTDEHYADIRPIILKLGEYRGQNPLINKCASRLEALLPKETPKPEPLAAEKAGGLLGNLFSYLKRS